MSRLNLTGQSFNATRTTTNMSNTISFGDDTATVLSLEKQKTRLENHIHKQEGLISELMTQIKQVEAAILSKQIALGNSNALFLLYEDPSKAPKQTLGAREAVLGTKRIIEREITKLSKEAAAIEMKLNKSKDRMQQLKGQIDLYRKEAVSYKNLFVTLNEELVSMKNKIKATSQQIEEGYQARSEIHNSMNYLKEEYEVRKVEVEKEWQVITNFHKSINASVGAEESPEVSLEQKNVKVKYDELEAARARHQRDYQVALERRDMFQTAINDTLSGTDHYDVASLVEELTTLEEEKFKRVDAINRVVDNIETLELRVAELRNELKKRGHEFVEGEMAVDAKLQSLEKERNEIEEKIAAVRSQTDLKIREIKSVLPVISFAFQSLGCSETDPLGSGKSIIGINANTPVPLPPNSPTKQALVSDTQFRVRRGAHEPPAAALATLKYNWSSIYTSKEDEAIPATNSAVSGSLGAVEARLVSIAQQYAARVMLLASSRTSGSRTSEIAEIGKRLPKMGPAFGSGALRGSIVSSAILSMHTDDLLQSDDETDKPIAIDELKESTKRFMQEDATILRTKLAAEEAGKTFVQKVANAI